MNRYFAKQIDQLLEYIKEGQAFGELCAYCYVIEYQKRGNVRRSPARPRLLSPPLARLCPLRSRTCTWSSASRTGRARQSSTTST